MTRGNISFTLLVGSSLGLAAVAHANYAFDNFTGPSLGYNVDNGWSVCGQSNAGWSGKTPGHASEQLADEFTAALGGTLTEIEVAVDRGSAPDTNSLIATLYSDSGANTLGTSLGSWTATNQMLATFSPNSIIAFGTSGTGITLTKGAKYWVYLSAGDPGFFGSWRLENSGDTARNRLIANGSATQYGVADAFAFNVQVQPPAATPEPVTSILAAVGLGLAGARRVRRR